MKLPTQERREEKSIEKRLNWARFPFYKPLNMFHINEQTAITERQLKQLVEYQWLEQAYNLILLGPPGSSLNRFNSHPTANNVFPATMGELIQLLKTEEFIHKSKIQLKRLRNSDLIIIMMLCIWPWINEKLPYFFS